MSAMNTSRDPVVDFVRELLLEAEFDRIASLTREQLREEFGQGEDVPPGWGQELLRKAIAQVDAGEACEPPRSNVVSLDERRQARMRVYSVASAAAMVLLVIGTLQRKPIERIGQRIDAWFSPQPTAPAPTVPPLVPPTHEETPQETAQRLREEAYVDIRKGYLDEAWDKLQDAKVLDLAGDDDPRVQEAYRTIDAASPQVPLPMSKPSIGPYEQPLKKR